MSQTPPAPRRGRHATIAPGWTERQLLQAARGGDEDAFGRLFEPFRRRLYGHCFRMLGSRQDAEDAMQEVMLRTWRSLSTFEGRASLGSWLYRIATNVCLSALKQRRQALGPADPAQTLGYECLQADGERLGKPQPMTPALESEYEQRETASVALSATLLHLPANQRAVLLLRDVLGFSARETAATLATTTVSVNSALQRARAKLDDAFANDALEDSPRAPAGAGVDDAVEGFVGALGRGDVDSLVGIASDTTLGTERSWTYSAVPAY
jgi:RNA polymerase sigma-70 factor, ECF subfamily